MILTFIQEFRINKVFSYIYSHFLILASKKRFGELGGEELLLKQKV